MIESTLSHIIFKNSYKSPSKEKLLRINLCIVMSVVKMPGRLIIRNRDIMNIFGVTHRHAQRLARRVRQEYNKSSNDYITIEEFCTVFKLNEERVREYLLS